MNTDAKLENWELALLLIGGLIMFFSIIVGTYWVVSHFNVH
jgi:heme/copper-type cytochrome/quinol oxidase subunit 4